MADVYDITYNNATITYDLHELQSDQYFTFTPQELYNFLHKTFTPPEIQSILIRLGTLIPLRMCPEERQVGIPKPYVFDPAKITTELLSMETIHNLIDIEDRSMTNPAQLQMDYLNAIMMLSDI